MDMNMDDMDGPSVYGTRLMHIYLGRSLLPFPVTPIDR